MKRTGAPANELPHSTVPIPTREGMMEWDSDDDKLLVGDGAGGTKIFSPDGTAPPAAHALGGAQHNADTLANLNTKVSDATLIDTGDSRLSDARIPTGTAAGGLDGTYPAPSVDGMTSGVLSDDAAHGVRGGGTQHADAVASGASGFFTGAEKTKLTGIATAAIANVVEDTTPQLGGNLVVPDGTLVVAANGGGTLDLRNAGVNGAVALSPDTVGFLLGWLYAEGNLANIGFGLPSSGAQNAADIEVLANAINLRTETLAGVFATRIGILENKIGFFSATPVVKPTSTSDIKDSLVALGLITDGGATPLNLDAGVLIAGAIFSDAIAVKSTASSMQQTRYSTVASQGAGLSIRRSKGATVGTDTVLVSGDKIATINFQGYDSTAYVSAAEIRAEVDGDPGAGDMPGRLIFYTTPDGSSTPTERLRIDSKGDVYSTAWTTFGGSSTIVGWVTPLANSTLINYKKVGNIVFIQFYLDGVSDATTVTFTLPFTQIDTNGVELKVAIQVGDNSAISTTAGLLALPSNSATVTCNLDMAGAPWTASGNKRVQGQFWFEAQ